MDRQAASEKVFRGSLAVLRPIWERLDDVFAQRGLSRDVKTIYVSYTDETGNIVAAVHPDPANVAIELALALPRETPDPNVYDAIHLKWRTLPVAVRLATVADVTPAIVRLIDAACDTAASVDPRPTQEFVEFRRHGESREPRGKH